MFERERGDVSGSTHGDFTDWDNPEDWEDGDGDDGDDEPDDYYEDAGEDEEGEWYVPGPNDPDYDLSEAAGYAGWEPTRSSINIPRWAIVTFSIVLILAMLTPLWIRIT